MIEIKKLSTGYFKNNPLLTDFSYVFEDNMIYGILGESGCGKSTLLKTIAGLLKPLDGNIYLDQKPIGRADKNNVYMMHQNYTSFNWLTCLDNILITEKVKNRKVTSEVKKNAASILHKVKLGNCIEKYPQQLSGGMRQRLALARTLYMKPSIILMDEPLSALDEKTRKEMQDLILDIHRETKNIIIMVTHSEEEAKRLCDKIIYL